MEKLREEGSVWQQRVQQLSEQVTPGAASQLWTNTGSRKCPMNIVVIFTCVALQVHTMAEEKEKHMAKIQELEDNVTELLSTSGRASKVGLLTAEWSWITVLLCRCFCTGGASRSDAGKAAGDQVTLRTLFSWETASELLQ